MTRSLEYKGPGPEWFLAPNTFFRVLAGMLHFPYIKHQESHGLHPLPRVRAPRSLPDYDLDQAELGGTLAPRTQVLQRGQKPRVWGVFLSPFVENYSTVLKDSFLRGLPIFSQKVAKRPPLNPGSRHTRSPPGWELNRARP